jgi:plasmid stabilization system protein ParE
MGAFEYALKFSPTAERDLDEIYAYIAGELCVPGAAENLMDQFETGFMRLKRFPGIGSFVSDEHLRQRGYRKPIVKNHIAFYIVNDTLRQVEVMRVLYGASDYEKYL